MNHQPHQAQEKKQLRQPPLSPSYARSFSEWYSNTTGMFMDKLCFACVSSDNNQVFDDDSSDFEEFDAVYAYDNKRKEPIRKFFESYELSGELEDNGQNITRRTHSLLQESSNDEDDDDDAPRGQNPTHSRENSCDSLLVLSLAAVQKPTLHPPISPSDTNSTVSLSQSIMDDDDEDWRSTTSTEVVSHLFRPKRKHSSSSSKSGGNKSYESYRCLPRRKQQNLNYTHGGDHADE